MKDFSYPYYIELITNLKTTRPLMDFSEIKDTDNRFFIIRHDVEFSVEKAFELAQIESENLGITSSYLFQTRNYSYNPFSFTNMKLIKEIAAMGHKIGLHVNMSGLTSLGNIEAFIKSDVNLLQNGLDLPIDRFSYHRPSYEILKRKININGLINTYDDRYFHLHENALEANLRVSYCSDSEHKWKYGEAAALINSPIKKLQLLIHPYSWSKEGLNNFDNFKALTQFKYEKMLESMNSECKNFPPELLINEKI